MGHSGDAAMLIVKTQRPQADPYIWYIRRRILQMCIRDRSCR